MDSDKLLRALGNGFERTKRAGALGLVRAMQAQEAGERGTHYEALLYDSRISTCELPRAMHAFVSDCPDYAYEVANRHSDASLMSFLAEAETDAAKKRELEIACQQLVSRISCVSLGIDPDVNAPVKGYKPPKEIVTNRQFYDGDDTDPSHQVAYKTYEELRAREGVL